MQSPNPLDPQRVRKIQGSFSWIDHRFISGGFLEPFPAGNPDLLFLVGRWSIVRG